MRGQYDLGWHCGKREGKDNVSFEINYFYWSQTSFVFVQL